MPRNVGVMVKSRLSIVIVHTGTCGVAQINTVADESSEDIELGQDKQLICPGQSRSLVVSHPVSQLDNQLGLLSGVEVADGGNSRQRPPVEPSAAEWRSIQRP